MVVSIQPWDYWTIKIKDKLFKNNLSIVVNSRNKTLIKIGKFIARCLLQMRISKQTRGICNPRKRHCFMQELSTLPQGYHANT